MTRIDFYILPAEDNKARELFACRLIEKAWRLGHRIYVHTNNENDSQQFDELLWSYRSNAFIPHELSHNADSSAPAARSPIEIGHSEPPEDHHDVLINLALLTPDFFARFERVSEVVVQNPQVLEATRAGYQFYRRQGYLLKRHDLRN